MSPVKRSVSAKAAAGVGVGTRREKSKNSASARVCFSLRPLKIARRFACARDGSARTRGGVRALFGVAPVSPDADAADIAGDPYTEHDARSARVFCVIVIFKAPAKRRRAVRTISASPPPPPPPSSTKSNTPGVSPKFDSLLLSSSSLTGGGGWK